ncbi:MAG: galactokinase [Clostridiales Family XIII bacterium]|jgi:galactokinase|nr:galactokinase [Clostridiales Family XIII bacterium]
MNFDGYDFESIYSDIDVAKARYERTYDGYMEHFGVPADDTKISVITAPGRTEVGGNHTDHQHGIVLAAAIDLDILVFATPNNSDIVNLYSEGYGLLKVDIANLDPNQEALNDDTSRLILGMAAWFKKEGYNVNGFNAYMTSDVLGGSGLSSSAAFEVAIGNIFNHIYCEDRATPVDIAIAGKYGENFYMNKPSGLMDQTASSVGGFVLIDFNDPTNPIIKPVQFDLHTVGYALCIVDTKGSHADLTNDYASMPIEMKSVAHFFGKEVLRDVSEDEFYGRLSEARAVCGDRAILRTVHFFAENKRPEQEVRQLETGDFKGFLQTVRESGTSSYKYLQNIYAKPDEQEIAVGLAVAEHVLDGEGAVRVHGGGLAGTIQAFVPATKVDIFKSTLEAVFGGDSVYLLNIRPKGGTAVTLASYK